MKPDNLGNGVRNAHWHALILAGGKGERFWPWSREKRPKQLLPLFGSQSMIEMTVRRLLPLIPRQRIWILTNAQQARRMQRLMPWLPRKQFIVEPVGRDSAGAVMLGCATVSARDPEAVMALLPADALIKNRAGYLKVMKGCFEAASREKVLVTVGIPPTEPSPAYGYIERGAKLGNLSGGGVTIFKAKRFHEKPELQKARRLVKTGRFYWNAGMFIWSGCSIREAFVKYSPVHARGWDELLRNARGYMKKGFLALPKISIDYAVMEKAGNVCVADGSFDWDDVGSWSAMAHHLPLDRGGNATRGEVFLVDSKDCLVLGEGKPVAILGVRGLVVVQTPDATLICDRAAAQRVKEIVAMLPAGLK